MPTIGWFEILIIVALAIIIVGPKDFPLMLKKLDLGSAILKDMSTTYKMRLVLLLKIQLKKI